MAKNKVQKREIKQGSFDKHIKEQQKVQHKRLLRDDQKNKTVRQEFRSLGKQSSLVDSRKRKNDGFALPLSQKRVKKSLFDLDSQENDYELTHKGQRLDFDDDYKDDLISSASEDYDAGFRQNPGELVEKPGELGKKPKSSREVYQEIMHKSKMHKSLRQLKAEKMLEQKDNVEKQFEAIEALLNKRDKAKTYKVQGQGILTFFLHTHK